MRGVALRCMGDFQAAAESYRAAVDVCQECEDVPNWAVAQANQGMSWDGVRREPPGLPLHCSKMTFCLVITPKGFCF